MTQPASTCAYCSKEGTPSTNQRDANNHTLTQIRFQCDCGNTWITDRLIAELQGRFLDNRKLR